MKNTGKNFISLYEHDYKYLVKDETNDKDYIFRLFLLIFCLVYNIPIYFINGEIFFFDRIIIFMQIFIIIFSYYIYKVPGFYKEYLINRDVISFFVCVFLFLYLYSSLAKVSFIIHEFNLDSFINTFTISICFSLMSFVMLICNKLLLPVKFKAPLFFVLGTFVLSVIIYFECKNLITFGLFNILLIAYNIIIFCEIFYLQFYLFNSRFSEKMIVNIFLFVFQIFFLIVLIYYQKNHYKNLIFAGIKKYKDTLEENNIFYWFVTVKVKRFLRIFD